MPSSLRLQTLGSPLLFTAAGDPVRLRTRKHFALLIRLALEPAKRFTRDYLMDLLWSDAPSRKASHSLAQALSVLRAKVGREAVHVHRATVALGAGAVEVDTAGLAGAETEIRGPFLEGFEIPRAAEFEQWKDEWRAKLLPQVRDCLVRQMDAARRTADFGIVERRAQTLLDLDPLSEDAVRGLMEGRAWVGDRTGALKVYSTFETLVAQDLGAKPSADLARTASLLREGRRPLLKPGEPPQARVLPDRRFEPETLIGRQREFSVLYDAWLDVRRKQPRVVGVIGDPGIGKTTLTNAFLSTCQMDGAIVARTQAYDAERELPFAVLAEVVRQLLAFQGAIASADPDALSELSRIAPEVRAAFPGVPKPIDWGAEVTPLRLADAFLKTLTAAADESPVVVVVDDVHAADNASVAILHLVARKLPQARLMFVFPARPGELRAAAAPVSLLSDSAIVGLRTLELEALTDAASAELLRQVTARTEARHGPPPIERVLRSCRGNPLAIELLTREWLEHGAGSLVRDLEALDAVPAATVGIPRAIKAVFDRQVLRLDPKTRSVLDLAAVLGRRIGDFPIYEVVSRTAGEAAETMARLVEEGFLHDARGALEFRNELIRAQAYYAVAAPVRQHLHREVATVLARRAGAGPGVAGLEVAWHFLRAGDSTRALPFALAGARAALEVGAPQEIERILSALMHQNVTADSDLPLLLARALVDQTKGDRIRDLVDPLLLKGALDARAAAGAYWMKARAEFLVQHTTDDRYMNASRDAV
ncbi:MAG TPA: AAA family ATPase, partial [Gemmatimonadales bacterium]|nr:AAA family ATPase [Gemmatimonadales bacterium]